VRLHLAALVLPLLLASCGGGGDDSETINWGDYAPGLQQRIDDLADKGDCGGLQDEFDTAEANSNPDLMTYVDQQLEAAGCYE
jgi:hypothetical protein